MVKWQNIFRNRGELDAQMVNSEDQQPQIFGYI